MTLGGITLHCNAHLPFLSRQPRSAAALLSQHTQETIFHQFPDDCCSLFHQFRAFGNLPLTRIAQQLRTEAAASWSPQQSLSEEHNPWIALKGAVRLCPMGWGALGAPSPSHSPGKALSPGLGQRGFAESFVHTACMCMFVFWEELRA